MTEAEAVAQMQAEEPELHEWYQKSKDLVGSKKDEPYVRWNGTAFEYANLSTGQYTQFYQPTEKTQQVQNDGWHRTPTGEWVRNR